MLFLNAVFWQFLTWFNISYILFLFDLFRSTVNIFWKVWEPLLRNYFTFLLKSFLVNRLYFFKLQYSKFLVYSKVSSKIVSSELFSYFFQLIKVFINLLFYIKLSKVMFLIIIGFKCYTNFHFFQQTFA